MTQPEKLLKSLHVLVVDDMESVRSMIKSYLKKLGLEHIHSASNGERAWRRLKYEPVDLIVCDWDMPELSGLELLKRVRETEELKHIFF